MDDQLKKQLLEVFTSKLNRSLRMYMENCARCGACIEACHVYASSPETRYTAVGRAQNMRRLFEKYHKATGKLAPWLSEAVELDDYWMDKVYETAFTCTGCRRCMTYCPFGIDTQQFQALAKAMLIAADREPKVLSMLADVSVAKGQNIEQTKVSFAEACRQLQDEVIVKWRQEAGKEAIPLDVEGANALYVALAGKHSIIPAAAIMKAAGESWTLSYFEAVNFGAFVGNPIITQQIAKRIIDEALHLKVKSVVICECGTAYRVMRHMTGKHPFKVISFIQLIERYLRDGRIKVSKTLNNGRATYHDPCQMARNGGIYDAPRYILRQLTDNYVDTNPTKSANWCCGGGGGLVIAGEKDFRMMSAKVKAEQLKATGAKILATACENCHSQLSDVNEHYELGMKVEFISALVANALVKGPN
ncbi:MAG: (Fe-S)-binding protein [Deltaproteobacteria bacterium]|nr:(Fe-S)-binding protein [Deltaproteobacteria bacterium]